MQEKMNKGKRKTEKAEEENHKKNERKKWKTKEK